VSARALLVLIATATADSAALLPLLSVMTGTSPNTQIIHTQLVIDNHTSTAQQIREDEEEAANPGSNLFVTGIHPRLTEEEVRRLFEKYGDVETCSIMRDPHTRESRGFGFVNMVTGEQADAAKSGLQGEVYEGRTLSIEKARRSRPRTPTPGKYFGPPKRSK
jgi:RNA recognition motif-containing protein